MLNNYKYKDSGVDWLGELPTNWEIRRLKYLTSCNSDTLPESTDPDKDIRYVDISSVVYPQGIQNIEEMVFSDAPSRARRLVKNGDTIVSTVRTYLKAIAPIEGDDDNLVVSTGFAVIRPRYLLPRYLSRFLMSHYCVEAIASMSGGVSYPAVNASDIGNIVSPEPPNEDQQAIAAFLDQETARIDALIQKKERMIELLKEKRIALITRAVTKGLDSNAPLKDSGIEWLGKVPEHWGVKRLKYLSSCNDESLPETTDPDYEMLYVDISSVIRIEGITNKEEMRFEDAPSRARRRVRDGNIIVSTVRTYLRAIAPIENAEDNLIVSTGFAVLRPVNICSDYLSLVIQSHYVVESIVARSVGVSYPAINASDIGDINITIPPVSEQQGIVDLVRKATLQIYALQSKNEYSISLLREYRSSLIHHAVTGKIDLRGYDAQAQ